MIGKEITAPLHNPTEIFPTTASNGTVRVRQAGCRAKANQRYQKVQVQHHTRQTMQLGVRLRIQ